MGEICGAPGADLSRCAALLRIGVRGDTRYRNRYDDHPQIDVHRCQFVQILRRIPFDVIPPAPRISQPWITAEIFPTFCEVQKKSAFVWKKNPLRPLLQTRYDSSQRLPRKIKTSALRMNYIFKRMEFEKSVCAFLYLSLLETDRPLHFITKRIRRTNIAFRYGCAGIRKPVLGDGPVAENVSPPARMFFSIRKTAGPDSRREVF